ncbi:MAG: cytochrome c [Azovibrio sp.]|uniref:c-type cytochrome n=1 Tax=Azovibrio sp. TaxID=1872673 RepID=UPI003C78324B
MLRKTAPLLLLVPLLLAACGEVEDTRPGKPVATRQQDFKAILRSFEPMGVQLREKRYTPDTFLKLARELDRIKAAPWSHFGPDTHYPPTRATAKVWQEPERFAADQETFLAAVSQLRAAAESREEARVGPAYQAVQDSCRSCHKRFKK